MKRRNINIKEQIRKHFFINPLAKLRVRGVERTLKLPLPSVIKYCKELEEEGILTTIKTGNVVGVISVAFFFLCMVWGVLLTSPELKELHLNILRIAYPGFAMSVWGAILGAVEAFVYGWVFGAFFAFLCRKLCVSEEK